MKKVLRILPLICGALVAVAVLCLVALRQAWIAASPGVMAAAVAVAAIALSGEAVLLVRAWRARIRRPVRAASGLAITIGLIVIGAGGMANWLLSLQGAVFLTEGETVILSRTAQLQAFDSGLLSNLDEMRIALRLDEVELVATEGGFVPTSRVAVHRGHDAPVSFEVAPRKSHRDRSLWFHQGAFGFSPRIVILRAEKTVFDRHVPFLTRRQGSDGTSFSGTFEVEAESIRAEGEVILDTLDERMRGHSTLLLRVVKGDSALGEGHLLPGHFADIGEGYRVGFAGLKKWSEIDVSRRNYAEPMFAGAALFASGLLVWPLAAWRGW